MSFSVDKGRLSFLDREMDKLVLVRRGLTPFLDDLKKQIKGEDMSYLEMQMALHLLQFSRHRSPPKDLRKLHVSESGPGTGWLYKALLEELQSGQNRWILDALTWVLFAIRPLAIEELAIAVAIRDWEEGLRISGHEPDQGSIQELADGISTDLAGDLGLQLGPLWDLDDGVARIRHKTLKEQCVSLFEQKLREPYCHTSLAISCLRYLSLIEPEDSPQRTPSSSTEAEDLRGRVFDFRNYAVRYWPAHYRLGESSKDLDRLVLDLLGDAPRRRKWQQDFEILQVIKDSLDPAEVPPESQVRDESAELVLAAQHGFLGVVRHLLQPKRGKCTYTQDDIDCAADAAAKAGFEDVLGEFCGVSQGAPGKLALHNAAYRGNRKMVKRLLGLQADVTRRGAKGRTALIASCLSGDTEVIEDLIDASDIGAKAENGNTALHLAAGMGLEEIVKLLLSRDTSRLHEKNAKGLSAVSYAAAMGQLRALDVLLDAAAEKGLGPSADVKEDLDNEGWTPLHYAARNGFVDVVARLRQAGLFQSATTKDGSTPLLLAAFKGHLQVVEFLGQRLQPALEIQDEEGDTPLTIAARRGWAGVVSHLLSTGANSHHRDTDSFTAFQRAAGAGFLSVVKLLFAAAGSESAVLLKEEPALSHAATNSHFLVADYLLRHGEEVNTANVPLGMRTALFHAAGVGQTEMVRFLISKGAAVNPTVDTDVSALHYAAQEGHLETVRLLVKSGASVTALAFTESSVAEQPASDDSSNTALALAQGPKKGYSKRTPLHMSVAHPNVVQFFLSLPEYKCNVNICDKSGILPIHSAANGGHVESIQLLEAAGASINAPDTDGNTPLHCAAENRGPSAVQCLLDLGADPGAADVDGWCAFHFAVNSGNLKTMEHLVNKYEDRNLKTSNGRTPLHLALRSKAGISLDVLKQLISWGCNLEVQDQDGLTPLLLTIGVGSLDAVTLLIQQGAKLNTTTKEGLGPIHLAATKPEILRLVIDILMKSDPSKMHWKTPHGETALHLTCSPLGSPESVSILLEPAYKMDPNAEDDDGDTPVMVCCRNHGDNAVIALGVLIEHGGQACRFNKGGYTPLHVVAFLGHAEHLSVLLKDPAADLDIRDTNKDMTPLHLSAGYGKVETCRLLCERGANVNARATAGVPGASGMVTPLTAAILSDNENRQKVVDYLLAREDVQVNGSPTDIVIPLCTAAAQNKLDSLKALLARPDVDLEARGSDGLTPLITAAVYEKPDAMKVLLHHGANMKQVSSLGRSVLAVVVDTDNLEMVTTVFNKDSELMVRLSEETYDRLTPLQSSLERNGNIDVERFLVEHGAALSFLEGTTLPVISAALRRPDIVPMILRRSSNLRPQRLGLEELRVAVEVLNVELWRRFASCLPTVESMEDQDGWTIMDVVRHSKSQEFTGLVGNHDYSTPLTPETELHVPAYKAPTGFERPRLPGSLAMTGSSP